MGFSNYQILIIHKYSEIAMTVTEMVENLNEMLGKLNLSFEEMTLQSRQLESTDLSEISTRVQVIIESSELLIIQVKNVIEQGEDIVKVVGR